MNGKRGTHLLLVGKQEENRSLGGKRCRWMNNIKMDLRKIGTGEGRLS
jgi:hypothetical protein